MELTIFSYSVNFHHPIWNSFTLVFSKWQTYRVDAIFLHARSLQVITSIRHVQPLPAVADAFVDLRLGQIGMLLLNALMHVKVVEQVRWPVTADRLLVQLKQLQMLTLLAPSGFSMRVYLGFLGLSEFSMLLLLLRFFLDEGSSRSV